MSSTDGESVAAGPRVVMCVLGLGHSGSTLLERCIASHPDCVGIGELDATIRKIRLSGLSDFKPCTCGEPADACPVWTQVERAGKDDRHLVFGAIESAARVTGRPVVVDSSKRNAQARVYQDLVGQGCVVLVPVYLFRDVRSWVISRKVSRNDRGLGALGYVRRSWRWMISNMKERFLLGRMGVRPTLVCYEEFVTDPATVLAPVFGRGALQPNRAIDPGRSCQHSLMGNGMRHDPARNSRIVLDDKWRSDWRTRWLAPFVIGPLLYNHLLRRQATKSVRQAGWDGSEG